MSEIAISKEAAPHRILWCAASVFGGYLTSDIRYPISLYPDNSSNSDGRRNRLRLHRTRLDHPNHLHPRGHLPKRRETLSIEIAMAGEIECRLIADTDEEVGRCGVRSGPR